VRTPTGRAKIAPVVQVALFDLDNTLIDRNRAFREWAVTFADANGLGTDAVDVLLTLDDDGFATREEVFGAARSRFDLPDSVDELIAAYRIEYPRHFSPAVPVLDALRSLRQAGWRIAVVTNGPPSQAEKLTRTGLSTVVDACCISADVGWEKPDQRIFAEAIRRCGGDTGGGGTWMIGDSAVPDVLGGRNAGCRTIWLRRGRTWGRTDYAPDAIVETIFDAVDLLLDATAADQAPSGGPVEA
jgi:putative hydrolase of the HAD superfamily